ncbi:MAG: cytochrome-c peroxidase [Gammaproteobacteria bacterium]|nr:cytochrome-c peroxidase [Gammaproteobacteria bacterium]
MNSKKNSYRPTKLLGAVILFLGIGQSLFAANWETLPTKAPAPADNPTTAQKVKLGQILFLDPRLSSTGTVSCNSCHNVMAGGEDNRPVAAGVHGQVGGRSAPTVWNAAFSAVQFWDGRAPSLEEQAKGPVTNPIEMGMKNWNDVVKRLKAIPGYPELFSAAFSGDNPVTRDNAAKAIAAYERTLITPNSPYDQYVKGDKSALSEQQVNGMKTFADVGCANCHSGPAFNGNGAFMKFPMHKNGMFEAKYKLSDDPGRFEVTKQESDRSLFKVPTLRNIALTAPYFHNGSVKSLSSAVQVMAKTQLGISLKQQQVKDIVAFLEGLTGQFPEQKLPRLPGTPGETFAYVK